MYWNTLALSLALAVRYAEAVPANGLMARQFAQAAMMRFQCSELVYDRIDPLVQPGIAPSTHMHQVSSKKTLPIPLRCQRIADCRRK